MTCLDDEELSEELSAAALKATAAHQLLTKTPPGTEHYQATLNAYLQATILYMSIVSVAQARQYETLSAEVAELREMVSIAERPALVH